MNSGTNGDLLIAEACFMRNVRRETLNLPIFMTMLGTSFASYPQARHGLQLIPQQTETHKQGRSL